MKNRVRRPPFHRLGVLMAIALAAMMLTGGSAASAGGDGRPVFVSGNSTVSDCGVSGSDFALSLTGDLRGCWSIVVEDYTCRELRYYDLYVETGRELFVGKLRGQQGRFRTTYKVEAAYAKGFCQSLDYTLEVGGFCTHKVSGVSGVFAGAEGLITFIDVITGVTGNPETGEFQAGSGGNNYLYFGRIDLRPGRVISASAPRTQGSPASGRC